MPTLTFIEPDGEQKSVRALTGSSLLEVALSHDVHGLEGRCGGSCSCGTCHVRVRAPHAAALRAPSRDERDVLAAAATPPSPNSRLACQLIVTEALDGMVVEVAEQQ